MIAIFGALESEVLPFIQRTGALPFDPSTGRQVRRGKVGNQEFLLILTGMGKESARRSVVRALKEYPIHLIISTGCGGALNEKTKAGDIIVCSNVKCAEISGPGSLSQNAISSASDLVTAAISCDPGGKFALVQTDGVSIDQVCLTPQSKSELGRKFDCGGVDMESYWIGQIAAERNIPFVTVRSIFDAVGDDLTLLARITAGNKISLPKVLGAILRRPPNLKILINYNRNFRLAGTNLARVLIDLVPKI